MELLLQMLLKGFSKYSVNVQGMLVIVLTQKKQEDNFLKGTEEKSPSVFIYLYCCGFKTVYLEWMVATNLSVWILMALSIFI